MAQIVRREVWKAIQFHKAFDAPRKRLSACSLRVCFLRFCSSCKVLGIMGIVLVLLDVFGVLTIVPLSGV